MKQNFYFTFGQRYRHGPHPKYKNTNPDGWVRIVAADEEKARVKAFELFGGHYSHSYNEDNFKPHYFPNGEIEMFEV